MNRHGWLPLLVMSWIFPTTGWAVDNLPRRADVVVYGATAAGVTSAVSASREKKSVILVEPGRHVGGMVSGGLGATDAGNRAAIGGLSLEFFRAVKEHYRQTHGASSAPFKDCSDGFHFEPHVADLIFRKMLDEAKVEVVFGATLDRVEKVNSRLESFHVASGDTFQARMFIDASYEGDLMARSGVSYAIGREGRDQYGESIAGVQARSPAHQWPVAVPTTWPDGRRLAGVQANPAGLAGSGDSKTQAYNYRLCMTDRTDNRVPFPRPEGYDPARYELLARYLMLKPGLKVGQLMNPVRMPNGKTDTNNNGAFSTDHIGGNWNYPEASPSVREQIRRDHVAYVQGFLYFLANDPRVPGPLHEEMSRWGLAKDEFLDNDHWPHQLYVREARRMLGTYVMTQADIMDRRTKADSVGLGSYNTDSHHVQRVVLDDGSALNEGDFQVSVQPYAIPYRSLTPLASECSNLLVPICMSASHVAYGTIRMEPVYMILGQASGVAASMAIDDGVTVQALAIDRLVAKLLSQRAILSPEGLPSKPRANGNGLDPSKLSGVVVDDVQALKTGEWSPSSSIGPHVGAGYLHDGGKANGQARIRFRPKLAEAGRYEVRLYFTTNDNRATNLPVLVHSGAEDRTIRVDQRRAKLEPDRPFVVLGTFVFESGEGGCVELSNDKTDGHVIADAVQFILLAP